MIRGIFFDLYGTLFVYKDMKKAWSEWLHYFHVSLEDHGLKLSIEDFSKECNCFFKKDEPEFNEKNLTVFEERIKSLCSYLEIKIRDKDINSIADLIADKWQEEIMLDQDAISVLNELKKEKKLGLVSNFDHPRHVRKYLLKYGLDHLFDTIIISGEVGVKKPNPNIFKPAFSATGLIPNEVIYLGDTNEDVEAANAAGIMPILIKRLDKVIENNPHDFEIETIAKPNCNNDHIEKECKTIYALQELLYL